MIELSEQQEEALSEIEDWAYTHKGPLTYTLGGYAGTGKTSIIPNILEIMPATVVTYTNKAVKVLQEKGICDAITIFKHIYRPVGKIKPTIKVMVNNMEYEIEDEDAKAELIFTDKENVEGGMVIVDEASMLGSGIRADLESHGNKVLYVGDPFQLPPVKDLSVMKHCDYILTEVHRHGDSILETATAIRQGKPYPFVAQFCLTDAMLAEADMIVCYTNMLRHQLNARVRKYLGRGVNPESGDRVVCCKTDKKRMICNGETGTIVYTDGDMYFDILWDGASKSTPIKECRMLGLNDDPYEIPYFCMDYAYAMTAHKCQGSQYDKVIVYKPQWYPTPQELPRWLYTAATRAVKKLIIAH